ncbi:MAG TPA: DinB family protein [Bryobacteraceae bacterium]|nr:DinB family protein [Bryobacteraceae bacterium]
MEQSDDARKPTHELIARQYRGSLAMLGKAIELCPEPLWLSNDYRNRFWHIAYHAVFYTHLYLQPSEGDFTPWVKHRKDSNYLGARPWAPQEPFVLPEPYTKSEVLEYFALCRAEVEKQAPLLDLDAPSGFPWLHFNKLELQFYNIRHVQHHTGQLADRLRTAANIGVDWVRSE